MDHINTMFEGNSDYIVLCEISANGCHAFADLISFIRLKGY